MHILPPTLLSLLYLSLTSASASPSPPLLTSDFAISLVPRNTLFFRQLSDLQTFTAALGGVHASPITSSGDKSRPFEVDGNTFTAFSEAAQRSCDEQFQGCQAAANGNGGSGKAGFTVGDCGGQKGMFVCGWFGVDGREGRCWRDVLTMVTDKCSAAQQTAKVQDFTQGVASTNIGPDPLFPDFDLICEG